MEFQISEHVKSPFDTEKIRIKLKRNILLMIRMVLEVIKIWKNL